MKTIMLFFSALTGEVYNSNRSDKKSVSNFSHMMVEFMEFHKREFKFFIPRKGKEGRIWFHFKMEAFVEDESGKMLKCRLPDEVVEPESAQLKN